MALENGRAFQLRVIVCAIGRVVNLISRTVMSKAGSSLDAILGRRMTNIGVGVLFTLAVTICIHVFISIFAYSGHVFRDNICADFSIAMSLTYGISKCQQILDA